MKKGEIQDQLDKFERMKKNMEDGVESDGQINKVTKNLIETWKKYSGLSTTQKDLLQKDWDIYFERIRNTKAHLRFTAQGKAWKKNKMDLVREYAQKAKEQKIFEIEKPAMEDPMFLENSQTIIRYRWIISKLNELQKSGKEYGSFTF